MKKTVLTVVGATLLSLAAAQAAAAPERDHGRVHRSATSEFRNSNASAAPAHVAVQPEWSYRYSRGYSDVAGH